MQFKFLALATSLLAASSVQAAAIPADTAVTKAVAALTKIATQSDALTTSINKLKPTNILTNGFTVLTDLTKLFGTVGTGTTAVGVPALTANTASLDNQALLCTTINKVTTSLTSLLTALNNQLSIIAGSLLAIPLQVVVGLLSTAVNGLNTQVVVASPSCAAGTDANFDLLTTLFNTLTLTNTSP
ncbi:hypothetical protein G7Z17_g3612 [Cylindrodendrum hubeiense]|uniref:Uncharacterized protein n=1 Tax=Cylindrodendrum hubeiense TaxID=595255 RepID=A0A9P5LJS6_9HYPO|nr:hypothetical protein G7Z17_g3612 [Cylindrodendrum hubeiense]